MNIASLCPGPGDIATAIALPTFTAPEHSAFEPLADDGRRLVVAADGVYIECRSPAVYARLRITEGRFPYGHLEETIELIHGPLPRSLAKELMALSLAAHPNEMAALIVARPGLDGGYELLQPDASATGSSVSYADNGYEPGHLVIDAHSHGVHGAYFSGRDDESDLSRGGPHVSIVFGKCATNDGIELAVRVCLGSYFFPLAPADLQGIFE